VQTIPLVDVRAEYEPLIPRLEAVFREVLEGERFIRGPHYWAFQEEAAASLGVKRTIGVANGTDALVIALDALGIGPGDEVICPAFIDLATLNLDLEDTAARVTDRTRAIVPVDLFGRPLDVRPLMELGVPVLEDAAQAFGAPGVARHATISTFSFYPTKNLFCLGDGGLVATDDEELADRVQLLSFHGSRDKTAFDLVGYNSRLDELQAAFLRIFLPELAGWNEGRRAAAARYAELGLGELVEIPQDEPGHVYHLFVCRSTERDAIRTALADADIASATYYTTPLHLQPSLRFLGYQAGSLPVTEQAATENFSLPLWPGMPAEAQERVVDVVRSAVPSRV
jgi:dTDP-4-amino-4,6-dideoxygalactose transaminase